MTDRNDRGADRAETARRTDDRALAEASDEAPAFGGSSGGNMQRDVGARAELAEEVEEGDGVTRVRAADKPEEADLPRFNRK